MAFQIVARRDGSRDRFRLLARVGKSRHLKSLLKSLALQIPPIARLHADRDAHACEGAVLRNRIADLEEQIETARENEQPPPVHETAAIDPLAIPIIILAFNQVSHLRRLVEWLFTAGQQRVIIVDNNSTYPPLLDYYRELAGRAETIRLDRNYGKTALWDADLLQTLRIEGPFVFSDSDVVPDAGCPVDLVAHLWSLLQRFPEVVKAGPGLRVDNLRDHYRFRDEVVTWETQFWRRPAARGVFLAPIDTTFAMYRPGSTLVTEPAVRTGWPYVIRHEPWYANTALPTEEERYYASTARNGHWARDALPEWLAGSVRSMKQAPPRTLLNLGCGRDLLPGWINVDVSPDVAPDIVYDLDNCASAKLPLADETVDGFFMCHVFEHLENVLPMMEEMHRVARPGARLIIRLPHGGSDDAAEDPTHRRACFPNSFVYFAQPAYSRADYGYRGDWRIERVKLIVDPALLEREGRAGVLDLARTHRNVVREMLVELSAVKPIRAREYRLLEWANPEPVASALDLETVF